MITQLSHAYIEYDCRFRQLAAKDKKVPWDNYKKDIFVWCFSPKLASTKWWNATKTCNYFCHSKPAILSHLGPATDTVTHTHPLHGAEICIRFNATRGCTMQRRGIQVQTHLQHERLWRGTPSQYIGAPPSSGPLKQIITPLQLWQYEEE